MGGGQIGTKTSTSMREECCRMSLQDGKASLLVLVRRKALLSGYALFGERLSFGGTGKVIKAFPSSAYTVSTKYSRNSPLHSLKLFCQEKE